MHFEGGKNKVITKKLDAGGWHLSFDFFGFGSSVNSHSESVTTKSVPYGTCIPTRR